MNDLLPMLYWYSIALVFFFGACWGSFLNVCIYRIPLELSVVKPRSHCPHCGKLVAWYDNVPLLSFLVLRARCRNCKEKISPRYFLVELLTAILFVWVTLYHAPEPEIIVFNVFGLEAIFCSLFTAKMVIYWVILAGLVVGTFIDFDHMILPDRITLGGIAFGLIVSPLFPSLHGVAARADALIASLFGLALGYGMLKLVAILGKLAFKKDAMGMGDVKLMGALGALLGWQSVIFIIMISSLLGSIVGIGLILSKKKAWQSRIPYGPYIALAAVIWMLGGHTWWEMYLNLVMPA